MKVKKKVDKQAALEKCAALCARAEHSAYEVRKKMFQWGLPKAEIEEVVEWLYDNSFIDDSRFAHAYARDKALFDCWGKLKIRHGLRVHGITSTLIDEALAEIDEKEYVATLQRLLKHKNSLLREDDAYKRKSALYRYGTTRGFESALVVKHLNALVKGGEDFEEW